VGQSGAVQKAIIHKADLAVNQPELQQYGKAVHGGHTIDTVHEVVGIDSTDNQDKSDKDGIPGVAVQPDFKGQQSNGDQMNADADPVGQGHDVIQEADQRDAGKPSKEIRMARSAPDKPG